MTVPLSRRMTPRLPRSGQRRLERARAATTATSLLSVPSDYGLRAVGFEAVGDVMGCIGYQVSHEYLGGCGTRNRARPVITMAASGGGVGSTYLRQMRGAYATALRRLRDEASALGADGVVGIDLRTHRHEDLHETVAIGTAVRSRGRTRPGRLFTTDLSGEDVAKLLLSGWTPVELHVAVQVALRHNDWITLGQANPPRNAWINVEVTGYSELRQRAVGGARSLLASAIAKSGASGGLLSRIETSEWHRACVTRAIGEGGGDHVAQALAIGSSIVQFEVSRRAPASPLTILPVNRTAR